MTATAGKSRAAVNSSTVEVGVRIGVAAKQAGTTARTIRYYEEIGLLPPSEGRVDGKHRLYTEDDIARVREVLRLKNLLGLSLDELKEVIEAEEARAELRARFKREEDPAKKREILHQALGYIERQLELVHRRRAEMDELEEELASKRKLAKSRLRSLGD
jgi:DNA-binding transcriptional MerR regulator